MKVAGCILLLVVFAILIFSLSAAEQGGYKKTANIIFLKNRIIEPQKIFDIGRPFRLFSEKNEGLGLHAIASFDSILSAEERAEAERKGMKLLEYIPENSWIVYFDGTYEDAGNIKKLAYLGRVMPADKISQRIPQRLAGSGKSIHVNVVFFRDIGKERAEGILDGFEVFEKVAENIYEIEADYEAAKRLAYLDEVQWVEPAYAKLAIHNDGARAAAGVNAVQASPYGLNGTGVAVAMWDAGYANHSDYNSRATIGDPGEGSNHFHATHVAGTLAGNGNLSASKGGSVYQWRGMATNATLITYEWPNSLAEIFDETNHSVAAYGAVISSNSWGYDVSSTGCDEGLGDYDSFSQAYDLLVTGNRSYVENPLTIVFSAGNERDDTNCNQSAILYNTTAGPGGTAKNVITVGAVNSNDNSMTSFSSWGPVEDGRIKPEVVAPGSEAGGDGGIKSTGTSSDYTVLSGTSMSAPAVSGIAALIYQEFRARNSNSNPLPSAVRALLVHTAKDLNETGPDYTTGYGLVNATAAIDVIRLDVNGSEYIAEGNLTQNGQNRSYKVFVGQNQTLRVTLAWDDYPASVSAFKTLVNDLDLVVLNPSGQRYYPWTLEPTRPAASAVRNRTDSTNVIEVVEVANATGGIWTIAMNATSLPQPNQSFSVVSSHDLAGVPSVSLATPQEGHVSLSGGVNFTCTAADSIALKNMTLYTNISGSFAANQTFGISGTQNSSSWNLTGLQDGLFIWSCLVYNTNSIPAWADSNRTFAVDRGPYWSSNISSFPSAYSPSQPSFFNITWNSSHGISAVYIEGNWSGQKNHTMQNANGTYRYNETLPAGSFYWKSYANTTNNAWNSTPSFYFSIAKAASPLRLFLNGSEGNISVNQNSSVNITAILSVTDSIAVYVNGTLRVNGSSPLTNITIFAEAGTFNVTAIYGGNENYTANSTTRYAVVNDTQLPVITSMDIFPPLTTVGGNMTVTAGITDNVNVTYAEYNTTAAQINGTLIRQGNVYNATVNTIGLAAGDYNVTVTARDGAGNSANSSVAFKVGGIRNITIRALDRNASSANVTGIRLVYNNRSEAYNQSQQNSSSFSSTLAAGVWDIAMLADFNFTVFSINVSDNITVNLTHDFNMTAGSLPASVRAFISAAAIESSISFSRAVINISYNEAVFVNESRIAAYACHSWSISNRTCLSTWQNVSANATFYIFANMVSIVTNNLSAFAVAETAVCGDGIMDDGESCDGNNLNGQTCQSRGFSGGTLSCSACSFVETGCTSASSSGSGGGAGGGGGGGASNAKAETKNNTGEAQNKTNVQAAQCTASSVCEGKLFRQCIEGGWVDTGCEGSCTSSGCITEKPLACSGSERKCSGNVLETCVNGEWHAYECGYGCENNACIKMREHAPLDMPLFATAGFAAMIILVFVLLYTFLQFERTHRKHRHHSQSLI